MRETLHVILEQFPVCHMETVLEDLLSILTPNLHSPCAESKEGGGGGKNKVVTEDGRKE